LSQVLRGSKSWPIRDGGAPPGRPRLESSLFGTQERALNPWPWKQRPWIDPPPHHHGPVVRCRYIANVQSRVEFDVGQVRTFATKLLQQSLKRTYLLLGEWFIWHLSVRGKLIRIAAKVHQRLVQEGVRTLAGSRSRLITCCRTKLSPM
jgi:hypothetical protein